MKEQNSYLLKNYKIGKKSYQIFYNRITTCDYSYWVKIAEGQSDSLTGQMLFIGACCVIIFHHDMCADVMYFFTFEWSPVGMCAAFGVDMLLHAICMQQKGKHKHKFASIGATWKLMIDMFTRGTIQVKCLGLLYKISCSSLHLIPVKIRSTKLPPQ